MNFDAIPWGTVDLVTAIVLIVGIFHGRKRGLSEEILPTLQWLATVVVGGLFYRRLAQSFGPSAVVGRVVLDLSAYALIALSAKLLFSFLKRRLGEKIMSADLFGSWEYYLGMVAGTVRFACIYLFLLNFLHAPLYTPEMLAADAKEQEHWFGSIRRPTIGTVQHTFFKESATGWAAEAYLTPVLIESVSSATEGKNDSKVARRTQRVNAVIDASQPWK